MPAAAKWERCFADDVCDAMVAGFPEWPATHIETRAGYGTVATRRSAVPPPQFLTVAFGLAVEIGAALDLDVNAVQAAVVRYGPGDEFTRHRDREANRPETHDRTVSYSLLLSDPADFDGGALIVDGLDTELGRGDLVAFSATTWHEVAPVTAGERLVLIAFGLWRVSAPPVTHDGALEGAAGLEPATDGL